MIDPSTCGETASCGGRDDDELRLSPEDIGKHIGEYLTTSYLVYATDGGTVLGVYDGSTPAAAIAAMTADAGSTDAPAADLRAVPVSSRADCERIAGEMGGEAWDRYVETRATE